MDKRMMLKLNAGRCVSGILRGFDPFMNVVIDETVEECRDGTKNNIGMVVRIPSCSSNKNFFFHIFRLINMNFENFQVIRGNSIVMVEGLERV